MHDDQLARLLRQVDEPASPDPAFADRLFGQLTRTAGRPRSSHLGLLLVAALLVAGTVAAGLAAGSGLLRIPWLSVEVAPSPSGLPIASETAAPTPASSPSPAPTPLVTPPPGTLPPGSTARVEVDGLRVRRDPSTTAFVMATLSTGDTVKILHNIEWPLPITAGGIRWYEIETSGIPPYGWVAAGDGSTAFLTLSSPETCEDLSSSTVTLTQLVASDAWHRLACLGDTSLTLTGVIDFHCQGGARGGIYQPVWMVDWCQTQTITPQETVSQPFPHATLDMVAAPGGPSVQPRGTIVRVTGHFDDPAASRCVIENSAYDPGWTVQDGAAVLLCREQFVVTEIVKTGFMELPPE